MHTIKQQARHLSITVAIIVLGLTIATLLATQLNDPPAFSLELVIFLVGTAGGVANNYRRLQNLSLDVISGENQVHRQLITFQIYISPVVGGIFAIALYLLFMSNILQGTLFPAFSPVMTQGYNSFKLFAHGANPATNQDAAKAIVWAFIAGFSEGLVPNFIDKIGKEATDKDEAKAQQHEQPVPAKLAE